MDALFYSVDLSFCCGSMINLTPNYIISKTEQNICIRQTLISTNAINKLSDILDKELVSECQEVMLRIKEVRHLQTLNRQLKKFDRLQHKHNVGVCSYTNDRSNRDYVHAYNSNIHNNTICDTNSNNNNNGDRDTDNTEDKWIINLSSTQFTEAQTFLLARGEYMAAMEEVS